MLNNFLLVVELHFLGFDYLFVLVHELLGFGDVLDPEDANAIHAFVIEKAIADRALHEQSRWWRGLKSAGYEVLGWLIVTFGM